MGMHYGDEKTYGSAKYHGMKVGGVHHWTYPDGQWTERKVAPDRWEVTFSSLKGRNTRAPRGSGAELGSGYHWLIVAHQWADKLDANTYATQLEGSKYLLAFKKPDWPVWNTQFRNSKRHAKEKAIAALEDAIRRLRESDEEFEDAVDQAVLVDLGASAGTDVRVEGGEAVPVTEPGGKRSRPSRRHRSRVTPELDEDEAGAPASQTRPRRRRRKARAAPTLSRAQRAG